VQELSESAWPPVLETPESRLGKLQRGLGSGARGVFFAPEAADADLIVACVRDDPRLDTQVDSRDRYYALLLNRLNVEPGVLEDVIAAREAQPLDVYDPGPCLALYVLVSTALLGNAGAMDAIRRYLHNGRYWTSVLQEFVWDTFGERLRVDWRERIDSFAEIVLRRFPTSDSLAPELDDLWAVDLGWWTEWGSSYPVIRSVLEQVQAERTKDLLPTVDQRSLPTGELLQRNAPGSMMWLYRTLLDRDSDEDTRLIEAAAHDVQRPMRLAAVGAMAARQDVAMLPILRELADGPVRGSAHGVLTRALQALPYSSTRPTVREWLQMAGDRKRRIAASVIGDAAIEDDVEMVTAELTSELNVGMDGDQYIVCSLAQALGRNPSKAHSRLLRRAFNEIPYSYGRKYIAAALATSDPDFPSTLGIDCLWDAEPAVRAIGAAHASRSNPNARRKLDEIRSDPTEEQEVRTAATSQT
jgi:hypothetical protein